MKIATAWMFRRLRRSRALLAALVLVIPAQASGAVTAEQALLAVRSLDQRVATLGHRLARASSGLCRDQQWLPGFSVHHVSQYNGEFRQAAIDSFGLGQAPQVLALAAGGPAQRAGLQLGDVLLEADGAPLFAPGETSGAVELIGSVWTRLDQAFSDGSAQLTVARGSGQVTLEIQAEQGCASRFNLLPSSKLNARADGTHVVVTTAIGTFVRDDAELAAVLAHELAHNIQRHQATTGSARRSEKAREIEADRLSVYLMSRAGFDPQAAIRFWERLKPRSGLFSGSGHPNWRERVRILRQEIASLDRQRTAGAEAVPDFLN